MPDNENLAVELVQATKRLVAASVKSLVGRVNALEDRIEAIPAGAKGEPGERGPAGESVKGDVGAPGASGPKGDKGDPGVPGESGPAGERGRDGQPGPQGAAGEHGVEGAPGEPGLPGASVKGDPGQPGKDGRDGKDVELDAVSELVSIEVAEAVGKLPAAKDGAAGKDGKDGASIHPDTVALMVREAVDKAVGKLPAAKDGAPGRDAAELIVLPGIDEARSYPAGTYAKHAGGEIRAGRRTDPVKDGDLLAAGWTVAREGVSAIVITQGEDPREISVAAVLTSGTKAVSTFTVPMVIDKGVWREGEHQAGDHVSWDGSGWIAQRKTTDKPGMSNAWRLSTKRGRDGKDGKDAKPDGPPPTTPTVRIQ